MPSYEYMPSQNTRISESEMLVLIGIGMLFLLLLIVVLYLIFRNPFRYPYFFHEFDVSGKRNPDIENYIDTFLCDTRNWQTIKAHRLEIAQWKKESLDSIERSVLKKHRKKQYLSVIDDKNAFCFSLIKYQTRYRQRNYIRTSYKVPIVVSEWSMNWSYLQNRYSELAAIDFACTLQEYNSKNQRKLMKSELREQIKARDNYTCQKCGKYMPDEVGLHIDHIIPIAKGGKSIPSNLRVLCSRCNGQKGSKIE